MNEFVSFASKNKSGLNLGLAILMFVFFAFCPVCDILGKAAINGLKLVSDGKGLGFSRFLGFLLLLLPLLHIVAQVVDIKAIRPHKETMMTFCPLVCLVLGLLLAVSLPTGVALAWGAYLYLLVAIVTAVVNYLIKSANTSK